MSKKTKKAYTAEELFDAIPGDYSINEKKVSSNINNINKIHDINELFSFLYKQTCGTFTHADFNKFIMKNVSDNIYDHLLM